MPHFHDPYKSNVLSTCTNVRLTTISLLYFPPACRYSLIIVMMHCPALLTHICTPQRGGVLSLPETSVCLSGWPAAVCVCRLVFYSYKDPFYDYRQICSPNVGVCQSNIFSEKTFFFFKMCPLWGGPLVGQIPLGGGEGGGGF